MNPIINNRSITIKPTRNRRFITINIQIIIIIMIIIIIIISEHDCNTINHYVSAIITNFDHV